MMVRRTDSAPRRCPATRGRPRAVAQRPLPSMMIATWLGGVPPSPGTARDCGTSDMQDVFFLRRQGVVDHFDLIVGQLLNFGTALAVLVLGDLVALFQILERFHAVAPDVAHRDAGVLGKLVRKL